MTIYDSTGRRIRTTLWATFAREAVHEARIAHAAEARIDLVFEREPADDDIRSWRARLQRERLFKDITR